ncbi:hypothetical protein L596_024959 [Steinernema carpocapsae]|uniref:Uncharacterized protein n=1 Tax=Steinernema carpocapsae TaxID=34508 RepID=A0A4U5M6D6_STECR|nr:hypothetical protein L596_024959 [Steinernema carpocapsae]
MSNHQSNEASLFQKPGLFCSPALIYPFQLLHFTYSSDFEVFVELKRTEENRPLLVFTSELNLFRRIFIVTSIAKPMTFQRTCIPIKALRRVPG